VPTSTNPPERAVPKNSLSSLVTVPAAGISAALSAAGEVFRRCLRGWLLLVPDPRKWAGRWHPLKFVLALAVCAFTAAGHDSPTAIAEWARDRSPQTLPAPGGRQHPLVGHVGAPSARTFRRVFAKIDAHSFNQALYGFLEVTRHRHRGACQRLRSASGSSAAPRKRAGRATQPAAAGRRRKAARGAVRPDGTRTRLLSAYHAGERRTMAQREVDAKPNEIPELAPMLEGLYIRGIVFTIDTLCIGIKRRS
jgi:hypothetical protein